MSRMMLSGGLYSCTRSIQAPDRSVRASRLASVASHAVSKRPIWLLEAAGDGVPHGRRSPASRGRGQAARRR